MLTGSVCCASKRSLVVQCSVSGPVPCSGARRRSKNWTKAAPHSWRRRRHERLNKRCGFLRPLDFFVMLHFVREFIKNILPNINESHPSIPGLSVETGSFISVKSLTMFPFAKYFDLLKV